MPDGRRLPGWGDTGEEWAELDAMDEEELRAAEATLQGIFQFESGMNHDIYVSSSHTTLFRPRARSCLPSSCKENDACAYCIDCVHQYSYC